jgi:hypothetical protein
MEEKKKFEKPELKVVELKQNGMICTSCTNDYGCSCDEYCDEAGE